MSLHFSYTDTSDEPYIGREVALINDHDWSIVAVRIEIVDGHIYAFVFRDMTGEDTERILIGTVEQAEAYQGEDVVQEEK